MLQTLVRSELFVDNIWSAKMSAIVENSYIEGVGRERAHHEGN